MQNNYVGDMSTKTMKNILTKLWLTEKETEVYLLGLSSIRPTAQFLSKKTGIKRSSIYDVIDSLSRKGLITKCIEWKHTYFQVFPPEELLSYLDRNKREIEKDIEQKKYLLREHLVELKSLQNIHTTKPQVRFYEGDMGMREAYEDTLSTTAPEWIRAFANVDTIHPALPNFFPEYYLRRKNKWIPIRAVFPNTPLSIERQRNDKKEYRTTKIVDAEKYNFTPEVNFYDNKVLIVSWLEKMAITIESAEIADCFKKMFDLLWEKLPDSPKTKD